jgi:hypothetical protein
LWCLTPLLLFNNYITAQEQTLAREINVQRQDSLFKYTYYYDEDHNRNIENKSVADDRAAFYPVERTEWIYEGGLCVSQRELKREENSWKTTFLIQTTYFGDQKVEEIHTKFIGDIETTQQIISYNHEGEKLISVVKYDNSKTDDNVTEKILYDYNSEDQLSSQIILSRTSLLLDTALIIDYKYNDNNQQDSVIFYTRGDDRRIRDMLTVNRYDEFTGNQVEQVSKKWDTRNNKWGNLTKLVFQHDGNQNLIRELYYHHDGLFWKPNTQYEYTYDADGLLEQKIMYQPIHNQWRKIFTIEYSNKYNDQPNLIESKYNFWGGETDSYVNTCIPYYFNGEIALMDADQIEIKYIITETSVITHTNSEIGWLKIYPNPSDGLFYISPRDYCVDSWKIYDISGMLIKSNVNQYFTGIVDLTNLPDGMYMILVTTDDNQQLKQKIIINRNH